MKVAIIGASGKTGIRLVIESLQRAYQVVAVCRDSSADKLAAFAGCDGFTVKTALVVSDDVMLARALADCDAEVVVLITVRELKATELVTSLASATIDTGVKRLVFTAGEVTAVLEEGETFTPRQWLLKTLGQLISLITPYSMTDMVKASALIREQPNWEWTILRAPTLRETPAAGYKLCEISEVTSKHVLSRKDYAACLLDSLQEHDHHRRMLTVISANDSGCRPRD